MNFKFKTLLASVVLATSAVSANAAIIANSGDSELVFSAWNDSVGYTYDLASALTLTSFIGADEPDFGTIAGDDLASQNAVLGRAVVSSSLITGPNGLIADVALTGLPFASFGDVQWNFSSVDTEGRARMLITADNAAGVLFANRPRNNGLISSSTILSTYYPQSNGFIPAGAVAEDTYAVTAATDGIAYAGNNGSTYNGGLFDTTNSLGQSSFLYFLAVDNTDPDTSNNRGLFKRMEDASGNALVLTTYQQAGQWRLNLSVQGATAPIPEPETYAMFLAGLGMMGAVARRRKGQVK